MTSYYGTIRDAVTALFDSKDFALTELVEDLPIQALLTVGFTKVGFAVLNGQPEGDYNKALEAFRQLYARNSKSWADFDLALVLCKVGNSRLDDRLRNTIEYNPYFCRKFVVDLGDRFQLELQKLPFVPLSYGTSTALKTLVTAQTYLAEHGVSSELGKYLAVPHAKGVEAITEKCLEGALGQPNWRHEVGVDALISAQYKQTSQVRLNQLQINNFRAYRGTHTFDLSSDLVVVFGPNGLGKTSLFDAIDFACTGGIARFDERHGRGATRLAKLNHLDSPAESCSVSLVTSANGVESTLTRNLKTGSVASINNGLLGRTSALLRLTGVPERPPDVRIENLVRLFRASHLFGQEYQSLTSSLRDKSELPEDIVSRMLALQDYVEAINKSRRVLDEIDRRIREEDAEMVHYRDEISAEEERLESLGIPGDQGERFAAASLAGQHLVERIVRDLGAQLETPEKFDKESVSSWRTLIETRLKVATKRLDMVRKLDPLLPDLLVQRKKVADASESLSSRARLLTELQRQAEEGNKSLAGLDADLKLIFAKEQEFTSYKENLLWLQQSRIEYQKLKDQREEREEQYRNAQAALFDLLPILEKAHCDNESAVHRADNLAGRLASLNSTQLGLNNLKQDLTQWEEALVRQEELIKKAQAAERMQVDARLKLKTASDELDSVTAQVDVLTGKLNAAQESHSELQKLIGAIAKQISGSTCPVCGAQHTSREDLLRKLEAQRRQPADNLVETLSVIRKAKARADELVEARASLTGSIAIAEQEAAETRANLERVRASLRVYETLAQSLGLPLDFSRVGNGMASRQSEVAAQIQSVRKAIAEAQSEQRELREQLDTLVDRRQKLEQESQLGSTEVARLVSRTQETARQAASRKVSLGVDEEWIKSNLASLEDSLAKLRRALLKKQPERSDLSGKIIDVSERSKTLEAEIRALNVDLANSKKRVEEVESLIKQLDLPLNTTVEDVLAVRNRAADIVSGIEQLLTDVTSFEYALDAAAISAAKSIGERQIHKIELKVRKATERRAQLDNWRKFFEMICHRLDATRNSALREHTVQHGPLASNIQRRLRSVYGFGELRLVPEKGAIRVMVDRNGREEKPSDYFSESQIQIVMLSLFLSASLTQTWSSFAPILMDDPVEHFDDLNAYALLDLIETLIREPNSPHQFIVSTCEERLFRLMRQKFSRLGDKAIFYVFTSIGQDGPVFHRYSD